MPPAVQVSRPGTTRAPMPPERPLAFEITTQQPSLAVSVATVAELPQVEGGAGGTTNI